MVVFNNNYVGPSHSYADFADLAQIKTTIGGSMDRSSDDNGFDFHKEFAFV